MRLAIRIWSIVAMLVPLSIAAGEVEIVQVEFTERADGWLVSTTLRHDDTGWEQYADAWRVVMGDGRVLGTRVLYHPHVNEQPFTRSLPQLRIPDGTTTVFVEAHCNLHGWSKDKLSINLKLDEGPHYRVRRVER